MPETECFRSTLATCMWPSLLSAIFATHLPEGSPWCFTASLCFSSRVHVCSVFSCLVQPSVFLFPTTGGAKRALVKEGVQLDDFVLMLLSNLTGLSPEAQAMVVTLARRGNTKRFAFSTDHIRSRFFWGKSSSYPLVNFNKQVWKITILNGKPHYFYGHFQ